MYRVFDFTLERNLAEYSFLICRCIDALIRTEVLVYFNSVHRSTRHSYGLFHRCEYFVGNSSQLLQDREGILNSFSYQQSKTCSKNFLLSFKDEQFDECHSLEYHRFCSKINRKYFDIDTDYLSTTSNTLSQSRLNIDSTSSCGCHYPTYVKACRVLGIFALVFLFITAFFFGIFPFLTTRNQRLKVKCFGVLVSIFAMLFILINLLVVLSHLEYETIEYLLAIKRHYRVSQIYKLSQDAQVAIDRFLSSINIKTGYSTMISWIAFILSIGDGLLLMLSCKITRDDPDNTELVFTSVPNDSLQQNSQTENEEHQTFTTLLTSTRNPIEFQSRSSLVPTIVLNATDEQMKTHSYSPSSYLKQSSPPRIHFEDSV